VTGFFVLRLWRKFTFVNRRKAKKPTEREAFGCMALGKANCEDVDAVDKSEAY
jgi:hypothetical protein